MSESDVTVGIVGCGTMGQAHARTYRAHDRTNVVAAADFDEDALETFRTEHDIPSGYETHADMLAGEDLDLVSVCTLHSSHAGIVIDTAETGVEGIWCEKPLATSMGETRDILDAVDRNDVKLTVGHQRRFHPVHEKTRKLIAEGAIGEPQTVTGRRENGLLNWGTHIIDIVRFVLGDPAVEWVMGQVERQTDRHERGLAIEDRCLGHICFDDGTRLTYESDMPDPEIGESTIQIQGTRGSIDLDLCSSATVTNDSGTEVYDSSLGNDGMWAAYLDTHLAWLDNERDGHRCDGDQAEQVMEAMMGIYESARTGGVVETPMQTRANPLECMIDDGDIPVEHPGAYDIRLPYGSVRMDD
jgi:predicted dehydrogenase